METVLSRNSRVFHVTDCETTRTTQVAPGIIKEDFVVEVDMTRQVEENTLQNCYGTNPRSVVLQISRYVFTSGRVKADDRLQKMLSGKQLDSIPFWLCENAGADLSPKPSEVRKRVTLVAA